MSAMDNPTEGLNESKSPGFLSVFRELRWKCVWEVCGHLCGRQCLLFFGTAAGLEKTRVDNHFSKPSFVDNPTAHLLSTEGEVGKDMRPLLMSQYYN